MEVVSVENLQEILSEIRARYNLFSHYEVAGYDAISLVLEEIKYMPTYEIEVEEDE